MEDPLGYSRSPSTGPRLLRRPGKIAGPYVLRVVDSAGNLVGAGQLLQVCLEDSACQVRYADMAQRRKGIEALGWIGTIALGPI